MKKLLLLLALLLCPPILAQTPEPTPQAGINKINPPIYWENLFNYQALPVRIREVDGSPNIASVATIVVPNGSLAQSGQTATLTYAVTSGTPGGSNTQLQYNNAGAFGGISGATTNGTVVTLTSPVVNTSLAVGGTNTTTSTSASCFSVGPNGDTNPVLRGVCSVASSATGISVTGNAAGSGAQIDTLSSGTDEELRLLSKGSAVVHLRANSSSGFAVTIGYNNPSSTADYAFSSSNLRLKSTAQYVWTNGNAVGTVDTGFIRLAAGVIRTTNGSTGQGSLCVGCTSTVGSIGTSGTGVLALSGSTAPSSSPADTVQAYSNDAAAGAHELYTRNEAGEIERQTGLAGRNSADFTATSDTTTDNITGLARNVENGRVYAFRVELYTTSNVAGGVKTAIDCTCTATSIIYDAMTIDAAVVAAQNRATALNTDVGGATAVTNAHVTITGTIVPSSSGSLTVQFSQNASSGSASTVLANSSFTLTPIS